MTDLEFVIKERIEWLKGREKDLKKKLDDGKHSFFLEFIEIEIKRAQETRYLFEEVLKEAGIKL